MEQIGLAALRNSLKDAASLVGAGLASPIFGRQAEKGSGKPLPYVPMMDAIGVQEIDYNY
jgi:hypothetical protein